MAFEASRILHCLGCNVRVFDPTDLPIKNDADDAHHKVQELRDLSRWSDGHVWCTPEQHGNLVRLQHPLRPPFAPTNHPDRRLQKPNRLDSPLKRQRAPNTRPQSLRHPSQRRLPVLQCRELAPHPRPLDAHVLYS